MSNEENMSLGDLELDVMSVLWQADEPTSVGEVQAQLALERELAYTTVLTVLSNLHKKGVVDRARQGRAHLYWAKKKPDQAAKGLFSSLLHKIYGSDPAQLLAGFLRNSGPLSDRQIRELREELRKLEEEHD